MKQITLTQNKVALVDDENFKYLSQWKWCAHKGGKTFYAVRQDYSYKKPKTIQMHRLIMSPPNNMDIDHINHCGTDNRRKNLRVVTRQQNQQNQQLRESTSSEYKGVFRNKDNNLWRAKIQNDGKLIHIGYFQKENDAGLAYNQKAVELFGSYAHLNPIPDEYKNRIPIKREQKKAKFQSRYTGITWYKNGQKWQARITKNKKTYFLGYFNTEQDAHQAVLKAKEEVNFGH